VLAQVAAEAELRDEATETIEGWFHDGGYSCMVDGDKTYWQMAVEILKLLDEAGFVITRARLPGDGDSNC